MKLAARLLVALVLTFVVSGTTVGSAALVAGAAPAAPAEGPDGPPLCCT